MESGFFQTVKEIALADRWAFKPVGAVQAHFGFEGMPAQGETGQGVYQQLSRLVTAFLPGDHHEPMVTFKAGRPALPNFPLVGLHRSGRCLTLAIAASSSTRSLGNG